MRTVKTTLLAVSLLTTQQLFAKDNWVDLFNGKDLTGWTQKTGNATYSVEDGCIVGTMHTPGNGTNSFLFTTKNYDNFILEMDFKADPRVNTGLQIPQRICEQRRFDTGNRRAKPTRCRAGLCLWLPGGN